MDAPANYTYEETGSQRIEIGTSGKEKVRVSCLFCFNANGDKLPVLCVLPRNNSFDGLVLPGNCIPVYNTKGTINSEVLVEHFIRRIWRPFLLMNCIKRALLVIDRAPCHLSKAFKEAMGRTRTNLYYIPARMTKLLQPADVLVFQSLKANYCRKWHLW